LHRFLRWNGQHRVALSAIFSKRSFVGAECFEAIGPAAHNEAAAIPAIVHGQHGRLVFRGASRYAHCRRLHIPGRQAGTVVDGSGIEPDAALVSRPCRSAPAHRPKSYGAAGFPGLRRFHLLLEVLVDDVFSPDVGPVTELERSGKFVLTDQLVDVLPGELDPLSRQIGITENFHF
jgi:hypothetical protein